MLAAPAHRTRPLRWTLALLFSLTTLFAVPALAAEPDTASADAAVTWLRGAQQPDGGFPSLSGASDLSGTADVVYALAAAGVDPSSVTTADGTSPIDYLSANASNTQGDPGATAKLLLALYAAGLRPDAVEPVDLIGDLNAAYDPATGFYGEGLYIHTLAVLALAASEQPLEEGALELFATSQIDDGSWGFTGEPTPGTGDSNTTAFVMQALAATDGDPELIEAGAEYLLTIQVEDGSFAYDANTPDGDANSTALAIQALLVAGEDPAELPNGDALAALAAFQKDTGAFFWQAAFPDDNLLATSQAVPALLLTPYPVAPVEAPLPGSDRLLNAVAPQQALADCTFFELTQHNMCGAFAEYWNAHNGLRLFGYPLSEAYTDEDGAQVQYFERVRFELAAEHAGMPDMVSLSSLGTDVSASNGPFEPLPEPDSEACVDFPETGQRVCGVFAETWEREGGLAVFGYPVTPMVDEGGMAVQYFERARFELQPGGWADYQDVFLGRIGAETIEDVLAE